MRSTRRFPPPWSIEELDACFVVKDSSGQKLAAVYYEEEPGRRSATKLLIFPQLADNQIKTERTIAVTIGK
ncbi:MAG: hypothetical protein WAK55_25480 [Xanthobacteraceae bacterium]